MQLEDLKKRASAHKDGLETAFDPLRADLDELKTGFWAKNREKVEARARDYIAKVTKEKVIAEASGPSTTIARRANDTSVQINKQLKYYMDYALNEGTENRKLEEITEIS